MSHRDDDVPALEDSDGPERTPDGHFLVINGRHWRASDPNIPANLRTELVGALMAARRAVRDAGTDQTAVVSARARVQDAKLALGERGEPWWETPSEEGLRIRLAASMRSLLRQRKPEATICPSDAARICGGQTWRPTMDLARAVAFELAAAKVIEVHQHGSPVDPAIATGALRLARGANWPTDGP